MPSRLSNDAHREKDWSFDDLSKKEQAAYREKEKAYNDVCSKRVKAEDDWRKGKISAADYLNLDKDYADQQHRLLYPNSPRFKQEKKESYKKGGDKKMSEVKMPKYTQREKFDYRAEKCKPGSTFVTSNGEIKAYSDFKRGEMCGRNKEAARSLWIRKKKGDS